MLLELSWIKRERLEKVNKVREEERTYVSSYPLPLKETITNHQQLKKVLETSILVLFVN